MFNKEKHISIIRASDNKLYKFYIDSHNNLIINIFENERLKNSSIFRKSILFYSINIDKNDKLHIAYIDAMGSIKYTLYPSQSIDTTVAHYNLSTYSISFLNIKIIKNSPHIFYMIRHNSINKRNYINHNYLFNNMWYVNEVGIILADEYPKSCQVDSYNDTLYLIYSPDNSNNYIMKKFISKRFKWITIDNNIIIKNANLLHFLIIKKGRAFICYNSSVNKNLQIFLKYKDLNKPNCNWNKDLLVSENGSNALYPSLNIIEDKIYILWHEQSSIAFKTCKDDISDLSEKHIIDIDKERILEGTYLSNHNSDKRFKSNYVLTFKDACPYPLIFISKGFTDKNILKKSSVKNNKITKINSENNNKIIKSNPNPNKSNMNNNIININDKNSTIEKLKKDIKNKNEYIKYLSEKCSTLLDEINELTKKLYETNYSINKFKYELNILTNKYNHLMNIYNYEITNSIHIQKFRENLK